MVIKQFKLFLEPLLEIWGESSKIYIDPLPNCGDACSVEISNEPEATPGPSGTQTQEKTTSSGTLYPYTHYH